MDSRPTQKLPSYKWAGRKESGNLVPRKLFNRFFHNLWNILFRSDEGDLPALSGSENCNYCRRSNQSKAFFTPNSF